MNTYKLSNVSLATFREYLFDVGCKRVSIEGGHEKWMLEGCRRPVIIQTHIYGGGLACIASIPLFIQSHRYKVKAKKSVGLSLNATPIPVSSTMSKYEQIAALGLAISL